MFFPAVQPAGADGVFANGGGRLRRGKHVLRVSPLGQTLEEVTKLNYSIQFYGQHAVHVRGLIVTYEPMSYIDVWGQPGSAL